jgi:RimJ/RimL family protein N-acetyltransferase
MARCREVEEVLLDYPKEVILKDGTGLTLRPIRKGDEEALHAMFAKLPEEDLWFLNHDVSDPEMIGDWIADLDTGRVVSIAAVLEGRIIGNAVLMRKRFGAKSHIGKIRISVDPRFRDRGLATWMLLDLINMAMSLGLRMLVMRVVKERDLPVTMGIKKLGFMEEAVLPNYVLDRAGNPYDLVIMTKRLPKELDDF